MSRTVTNKVTHVITGITGPAPVTDKAIATWNGTTGNRLSN